jgi:hypothetical protein
MGKALFGTQTAPSTLLLLDEVRALRARVDELERALAQAEAARDARDPETITVDLDDREPVTT